MSEPSQLLPAVGVVVRATASAKENDIPTINIMDRNTNIHTSGYAVGVRFGDEVVAEYDVYLHCRASGEPYLVLVGQANETHGWAWQGYEILSLLQPDQPDNVAYTGPTPETPHDVIVSAAVTRFVEDEDRAVRGPMRT